VSRKQPSVERETSPRQTRADVVRQRRQGTKNTGSGSKVPSGSDQALRSAQTYPVQMRASKLDLQVVTDRTQRLRKRYDIAVGSPGAELRLPALPSIRPSWRWLSIALCAALLYGIYSLWNQPVFVVTAPRIEGIKRIPERDINLLIGVEGRQVFWVEPAQLALRLRAAFPDLVSTRVEVQFPNRVVVYGVERQPVLTWQHATGAVWIDQTGFAFPIRPGWHEGLPQVDALDLVPAQAGPDTLGSLANPYIGRQLIPQETVEAILFMIPFMPDDTPVLFDLDHGLGWRDPRGWEVYFGLDVADIETRLVVYKAIVRHLKTEGIIPAMVSVEYLHAPFYRMER